MQEQSKQPLHLRLKNAKAIIFDLFDTLLIINEGQECFAKSLRKLHQSLCKNGFSSTFADFEKAYTRVNEQIEAETAFSFEEPHFTKYVQNTLSSLGYTVTLKDSAILAGIDAFCQEFNNYIQIDHQAIKVLQSLQKEHKLGLISNLSFPESAWDLLAAYNLTRQFDFIVISGDVNMRKPHRGIFNLVLNKLEVHASEAAVVGDTLETDIQGAINMGMVPVHIKRRDTKSVLNLDEKSYLTIYDLEQLQLFTR